MNEFAVISIAYIHRTSSVYIRISTNNPSHLTCYYSSVRPVRHKHSRTIRGLSVPWGAYFCFVAWVAVEQLEPGDTYIHTFSIPSWSYCQTRYFAFKGTIAAIESPSISPIFSHHHPGVTPLLFEHYITGDDDDIECWTPTYWLAQTFTPQTTHIITSVKLLLYRVGSPGTVTVSIRATLVGDPAGPDLCAGTTSGNTLPTAAPYEWREIALGEELFLEAGMKYAIVVRCLASDLANMLSWRVDKTSPAYAGGEVVISANSGGSWTKAPTYDFMFEEWGIPFI